MMNADFDLFTGEVSRVARYEMSTETSMILVEVDMVEP